MGNPLDMCVTEREQERINEILEKCAETIVYVHIERILAHVLLLCCLS